MSRLLGRPEEAAGCGLATAPSAIRVSIGVGTTSEHIDRLLAALAALPAHDPAAVGALS